MSTSRTTASNIDAYIAGFPAEVQEILQRIRVTIRQAAPGAEEAISYAMPTFKLEGNLVHFAAYKGHIGFYPGGHIEPFKDRLVGYKTSKGTVQFPLNQPIPYELIAEITAARVQENLVKAAAKGKRPK
jgi:uncharacterized protein YdhG (YjbR/CyaY superfamily)